MCVRACGKGHVCCFSPSNLVHSKKGVWPHACLHFSFGFEGNSTFDVELILHFWLMESAQVRIRIFVFDYQFCPVAVYDWIAWTMSKHIKINRAAALTLRTQLQRARTLSRPKPESRYPTRDCGSRKLICRRLKTKAISLCAWNEEKGVVVRCHQWPCIN